LNSKKQQTPITWIWSVSALLTLDSNRADWVILRALESCQGRVEGAEAVPSITRSQLKRLIEEGRVKANGVLLKAHMKLKAGMQVQIEFPVPRSTELIPEAIPLSILFEDEHLLVINKPAGLTVHPSATQLESTLVHALLYHIKDLSGIGGVLRPGIVHRIDKNTSGALVITKTDLAHRKLAEIFSQHAIERSYWAFCYGSPSFSGQTLRIESLIGRHPTDRKKMSMKVKQGRSAVTYIRKKEEYRYRLQSESSHAPLPPFASWLEATLETGRTHQVRVHLTGIGHSILGDPVYGVPSQNHPKWVALPDEIKAVLKALPGQALHARILGFSHPITGEKLRFEAPLPTDVLYLQNQLQAFL
jgi:23S rRNA pseudouridine1911/1915/1917 synthase